MWRSLSLVFLVFIIGCTKIERYGRGKAQEIVIVFDGVQRDAIFLRDSLEEVFHTPHPENLFRVLPTKVEQFSNYAGYKNVLILATTSSGAFKLFQKVFNTSKPGMYTTKNVFIEGDFVVGILSEEEVGLWSFIHGQLQDIRELFLKRLKEIMKKKAYFPGHDRKRSQEIKRNYGFKIDLPKGWMYIVEDTNFVSLGKHYPDRFMFFYHSKFNEPLDPDNVMNIRDSLAKIYYKGDRILRDFVKIKRDTFLGVECLKIYGAWENDSMTIGGPFFTWAFYPRDFL